MGGGEARQSIQRCLYNAVSSALYCTLGVYDILILVTFFFFLFDNWNRIIKVVRTRIRDPIMYYSDHGEKCRSRYYYNYYYHIIIMCIHRYTIVVTCARIRKHVKRAGCKYLYCLTPLPLYSCRCRQSVQ